MLLGHWKSGANRQRTRRSTPNIASLDPIKPTQPSITLTLTFAGEGSPTGATSRRLSSTPVSATAHIELKLLASELREAPGGSPTLSAQTPLFPANFATSQGRRAFLSQFEAYAVDRHAIDRAGGTLLLSLYNNQLGLSFMCEFPEQAWVPYKFGKSPSFWWSDVGRRFRHEEPIATLLVRSYLDELVQQFKLNDKADWDRFIVTKKPQTVLNRLNDIGPLPDILTKIFPEWEFTSSKHTITLTPPPELGTVKSHGTAWTRGFQKTYCDYMKEQLGGTYESLYDLTYAQVRVAKGTGLLALYQHSIPQTLASIYPEHDWKVWKFRQVPRKWFDTVVRKAETDDKARVQLRDFIEHVATQLEIKSLEEWKLDAERIRLSLRGSLRAKVDHLGGLERILSLAYPKFDWHWPDRTSSLQANPRKKVEVPVVIGEMPVGYWQSIDHQRLFFDKLVTSLSGSLDSLYQLTSTDILKAGGGGVLSVYRGSMVKALQTLYPDHRWHPWKFRKVPQRWWRKMIAAFDARDAEATKTVRTLLEDIASQHGLKQLDDWFTFSRSVRLPPSTQKRLSDLGGLPEVLGRAFPHHNWPKHKFYNSASLLGQQRLLKSHASKLLPEEAAGQSK